MSLRLLMAAALLLGLSSQARAAVVVEGAILGIPDVDGINRASTVDHWKVTVNSVGVVTIDVLSWEVDSEDRHDGDSNFDEYVDVNGDGEIAFFDSHIYLFNDDGSLDAADLIASNDDDFSNTYGDGSIFGFDSFLSLQLGVGQFILAIGAFRLEVEDAIDQINNHRETDTYPWTTDSLSNDHGDYRLTFGGDVIVEGASAAVPEPSTITLLSLGGMGLALCTLRRRIRQAT